MSCRFLKISGGYASIVCKKFDMDCPYQYWCTKDDKYKTTATKDKCKYYEEAENSEN